MCIFCLCDLKISHQYYLISYCLIKFRKHSNECLPTTALPDRIIARRSRLRKPADIGASANAYKSIWCKIINLQAARLLILQAEDY
ncbi:unknown [Bacteroides sp. CAG:702]|nr:unknown [Bacteroides sp. CAG:702]